MGAAPGGSGLRRVLGFHTLVSTSAGLAFAAVNFLAVMEVRATAPGVLAPLAVLGAGFLCLLAAAVFSELNGALPTAAGIRAWTLRGLGDPFSLAFTLLYLTTVLAVVAADAFVLASALRAAIPAVPGLAWILLFLAGALAANLRGVTAAGLVQDLTTYGLLAGLLLVGALALARPGHLPPVPRAWPSHLFGGLALAVFVFLGFEWVTPLSEELRQPGRMPQGFAAALAALAASFGLFALVAARLPASAAGLAPQLAVGREALGPVGFWLMLAVTVVTAGTTFNGSFVAASRLLYALGRAGYLPRSLGTLNRRLVPHRALWLLAGVSAALAALVFATRRYLVLINAGASLESAMYVVAALSLLGLRRREPGLPRPWRAPGGAALPWAAVLVFGALGVGALFAPDDLPLPGVPWTAVFLAVLAAAAWLYARRAVARRAAARGAGPAALRRARAAGTGD